MPMDRTATRMCRAHRYGQEYQSRSAPRTRAAPHEPLGGHCGTRTGAGPLEIETIGTARTAEHVASHRGTTLLSLHALRRAGAPWLTSSQVGAQRGLIGEPPRGDAVGD